MKPIPLGLLRKFCKSLKSFRISHVSSRRLLLLLAIWNEKVTKFTENILSLDPFQILLTCLHMNCTLGVVPYRFDRTEKRLCPQEGWKWLVWRLFYGLVLPLRLALSVCTLLFTSMKFKPIGNHVGVEELNLITYFVILQLTMLYPPMVYCLVNDSALVARLFGVCFQLDSKQLGKVPLAIHTACITVSSVVVSKLNFNAHLWPSLLPEPGLPKPSTIRLFLQRRKYGWAAYYIACFTAPLILACLVAIVGTELPDCLLFLSPHVCSSRGSGGSPLCSLSLSCLDIGFAFLVMQSLAVFYAIMFTVVLSVLATLSHAKWVHYQSGKSTLYSGMGIQFLMEFSVFQFHSQSHFWVDKFHIPIPNPVIALRSFLVGGNIFDGSGKFQWWSNFCQVSSFNFRKNPNQIMQIQIFSYGIAKCIPGNQ